MGVVVFTKVRGLAKSESLLVLEPLQKLLLPLTFRSNVPVPLVSSEIEKSFLYTVRAAL